jgi:DUF4097 and DUF4098 domain-containing protein YvlB
MLLGAGDDVDLTVFAEVPAAAGVRFEGVSADVQATGLVGDQRYATVSGDLFLTDAGGSARVNTVSGDVTLRSDSRLAVRADSVSGDLNVVAPRIEGMRANAVSGDIDVEGDLDPSGEFRFETVSGDLTIGLLGGASFVVRGLSSDISSDIDHRIEGQADRRRLVIGDGAPEVLFSSMSGDLSVRRPRRIDQAPAPPRTGQPSGTVPTVSDEDQITVLRALERGEIDVDEAARRLSGDGLTDG